MVSYSITNPSRVRFGKVCSHIGAPKLLFVSLSLSLPFSRQGPSFFCLYAFIFATKRNHLASKTSVRELSHMMTSLANLTPEQLSSYPALQPPPGVVPNFMHPENQNRPLLVATSIELGIMIVFVLNRFYSKSVLIRKYSWDDCQSSFTQFELESVANTSNSDSPACCCKY